MNCKNVNCAAHALIHYMVLSIVSYFHKYTIVCVLTSLDVIVCNQTYWYFVHKTIPV